MVLVDKDDWQAGVTAAALTARPIGAPILISDGGDLPPVSADTLKRLKPKGSDLSKDAQVIRIGDKPARPDGFKTAVIEGKDPYERAAAIDRFFSAAKGKPSRERGGHDRREGRVRDARRRVGRPLGRLRAAHAQGHAARRDAQGAARARQAEHLPARPDVGDLEGGGEGPRPARQGDPDPGPQPGGERDRLRPLRGRRLRMGRGGARLQLHDRGRVAAARRRRLGRARHEGRVRSAAAHRPRRRPPPRRSRRIS